MTPEMNEILDAFEAAALTSERLPRAFEGKLSMDEGYRIQLAMLQRRIARGAVHVGWKVGLTSASMQKQQNVYEPLFGYLLASGHKPSGYGFEYSSLHAPGFENELCLTIGTTLRGPGIDYDTARRAVSHIEPAMEIVERRGVFSRDIPSSLADNIQQKGFVTGSPTELAPGISLAEASVTVVVNGIEAETAMGAEVLGDPIHSVVWLANKLSQFGINLEKGMKVMSGSFTKQYIPEQGQQVSASFTPFGTVSVNFY